MITYVQSNSEGRVRDNSMGQLAIEIEEEQLCFYVDNGFKVKDMALMLGCSKQTVQRRLHSYNLSTRDDTELDELVQ